MALCGGEVEVIRIFNSILLSLLKSMFNVAFHPLALTQMKDNEWLKLSSYPICIFLPQGQKPKKIWH